MDRFTGHSNIAEIVLKTAFDPPPFNNNSQSRQVLKVGTVWYRDNKWTLTISFLTVLGAQGDQHEIFKDIVQVHSGISSIPQDLCYSCYHNIHHRKRNFEHNNSCVPVAPR